MVAATVNSRIPAGADRSETPRHTSERPAGYLLAQCALSDWHNVLCPTGTVCSANKLIDGRAAPPVPFVSDKSPAPRGTTLCRTPSLIG
jgi:hypothetical protein